MKFFFYKSPHLQSRRSKGGMEKKLQWKNTGHSSTLLFFFAVQCNSFDYSSIQCNADAMPSPGLMKSMRLFCDALTSFSCPLITTSLGAQ